MQAVFFRLKGAFFSAFDKALVAVVKAVRFVFIDTEFDVVNIIGEDIVSVGILCQQRNQHILQGLIFTPVESKPSDRKEQDNKDK